MQGQNSALSLTERERYYVVLAECRLISEWWSNNVWNAKYNPIGYHALYYRTDTDGGRAVLHTVDGEVELLPGRVYFVPAFSVLQSELDGKMRKYYIHFQTNSLTFGLYHHLSALHDVAADSLTDLLFDVVIDNYKKHSHDAAMRVSGALDLLLAPFFAESMIEQRNIVKFAPVFSYIEEHYREPIPLKVLADLMHISTMYFSNSFKAAFHLTPKQYILGKRLTESQRLLTQTDWSVKDVAHAVGFENENYFSEFFTSKVGVTAMQYRRRSKQP